MQSSYMFQFCSQSPNSPLPVVDKHVYQPLAKGTLALGAGIVSVSLHAGFSREKMYCPDASCSLTGKTLKSGNFAH